MTIITTITMSLFGDIITTTITSWSSSVTITITTLSVWALESTTIE
jgi:hypothetical protein